MILVIGYGNPLRGDDAIGQRIAHALDGCRPDAKVITAFQLTPELVEPISHVRRVMFIDARIGDTPGRVVVEPVNPESAASAFTHFISPAALLLAARELYDATPDGILFSVVGASFDYGGELSPQLNAHLPAIIAQAQQVLHTSASAWPQDASAETS